MINQQINSLSDLNHLRSAPIINSSTKEKLIKELLMHMKDADWFTVGIMASSSEEAILKYREMESFLNWSKLIIQSQPNNEGPVFLKGNQKTGDIHIRIEYGLGEGILITCQKDNENIHSQTFGPLPLDFFSKKI